MQATTYELKIERNIPPSMNDPAAGYRGNQYAGHRKKKEWEGLILVALMQAKVPAGDWGGKVTATAVLTVPNRIKRDQGNFRFLLEKALGDVLQTRGHIPDDGPDHFVFPELRFEHEKGVKRTTVLLEVTA